MERKILCICDTVFQRFFGLDCQMFVIQGPIVLGEFHLEPNYAVTSLHPLAVSGMVMISSWNSSIIAWQISGANYFFSVPIYTNIATVISSSRMISFGSHKVCGSK